MFCGDDNEVAHIKEWQPLDERHLKPPAGGKKPTKESQAALKIAKGRLIEIAEFRAAVAAVEDTL